MKIKIPKLKIPGAKGKELKQIQADYEKKAQAYIHLLSEDTDWDYGSVIRMLHFKLVRMHEHILEHKAFVGYEKIAKQIDVTIQALDRLIKDDYHNIAFAAFYKKHGKPKMVSGKPDEKGNTPVDFIYPNGKPDTEAMRKQKRILYKKEAELQQADAALAFKNMGQNIFKWWC